jgi:ferrochelatase
VICQSKVGPARWLGPDTVKFLEANAAGRAVVTVPIAFVSEHLETLYDMDILAREASEKAGAALYRRVPALGTRPDFIAALADLVRRGLAGQGMVAEGLVLPPR